MFRFETLDIWHESVVFSVKIFDYTETLPPEYKFSIGSQLNRSGLSPSNNIAEGSGSESAKDFKNFLNIAIRSIFETVSGLTVAYKKGLIKEQLYRELYNEGELLAKRIRSFRSTLNS